MNTDIENTIIEAIVAALQLFIQNKTLKFKKYDHNLENEPMIVKMQYFVSEYGKVYIEYILPKALSLDLATSSNKALYEFINRYIVNRVSMNTGYHAEILSYSVSDKDLKNQEVNTSTLSKKVSPYSIGIYYSLNGYNAFLNDKQVIMSKIRSNTSKLNETNVFDQDKFKDYKSKVYALNNGYTKQKLSDSEISELYKKYISLFNSKYNFNFNESKLNFIEGYYQLYYIFYTE